jgi:flagellar L-ring protein precursor FlgH
MKILITILIIISSGLNAQFIQNNSQSLFSDFKAFQEGDAVMILIMEEVQADNGTSTQENRGTNVDGSLGLDLGTLGSINGSGGVETRNDFEADGQNSRNERIRSRLTARVVAVEENGNLIIEGKRTTKINGETQTVTISGVVRQVDIRPDNSVISYNIMDLTLLIEGEGNLTEVQEPGLITKFIRFLF